MFHFGFELEGFEQDSSGKINLPSKDRTTDGFPGLIEIRTKGGAGLQEAYFDLLRQYVMNPFDTVTNRHKFTLEELRTLRKTGWHKEALTLSNLYNKAQKDLKGTTIASLQLNFSCVDHLSYVDRDGKTVPTKYKLFDFVPIIRELDSLFHQEIVGAGRQIGWYAVKDGYRVEYRSLPNSVFTTNDVMIKNLLGHIKTIFDKYE